MEACIKRRVSGALFVQLGVLHNKVRRLVAAAVQHHENHHKQGTHFHYVGGNPVHRCYEDSSCWRLLAHLASAAFFAMADLSSGVSFSAGALPPLLAPDGGSSTAI